MLQQTTPYFYIIKNKHTGLRYSGARWAVNCHPSEFMTENGYCTSSNTIAEIIKSDGLDAFEIEQIVTEFNGLTALEYETEFLKSNDCAGSDQWYNRHNNMGIMAFGTDSFKQNMLDKHGVENASQSEEVKEKKKQTNLSNRGVEHPLQCEEVKTKIKTTNLGRYQCENPFQNEEIKAKIKTTHLDNLGVEYPTQCEEVKAKAKTTNLGTYGCEHPMQNEEVKAKTKSTNIDRYGCENVAQNEEIKDRMKTTNVEKFGAPNYMQSETYRNTFYICEHCGKKSNSVGMISRWHNDNCKHKPTDTDSVV